MLIGMKNIRKKVELWGDVRAEDERGGVDKCK